MASKAATEPDTDDGSLTPSEPSDEERSEHDSDYETEHEDDDSEGDQLPNIAWTGYGKKTPVIVFKGDVVIKKRTDCKAVGERYHMAFKMGSSDCRIVRNILSSHGFKEVHPSSSDYNIMWTGSHLKPFTLRSLTEFQKINHFPRSYEITRKDRLFKNVQRMQQIRGARHFDFVAQSFIMPTEYQDFCACFMKEKGTWIVKPVASSRGRGVFLINHPDQVPLDENLIVSKYISNPILIDGFKFDVRLYVAVTSYDPIVIYLFEEGLTRFATVKYEKANKHIRNQCMHLTNYSVNKKNKDYVQNDDPDVEDYGNKWSLGALLRYMKSQQKDVTALMMRIEDVIIKTIMSAELPIATACKMFMPYRGNCFELYGFDILIDDNLKPWVLEVNLSPSLACDAPLDLKIKANMISDLLSLSGLMCQDPMLRTLQQSRRNQELSSKMSSRIKSAHFRPSSATRVTRPRPQSAGGKSSTVVEKPQSASMAGLTSEEIKVVRRVKEEEARKGGWVRIFPSPDSWDLYGPFLQFSTTHNAMLHQRLYPERHKKSHSVSGKSSSTSIGSRNRTVYSQLSATPLSKLDFQGDAYGHALLRTRQYMRKLNSGNDCRKRHRRRKLKSASERAKHSASTRKPLVQGVAEEDGEDEGEEIIEADEAEPVSAEPEAPPPTEVIDKLVPEDTSTAPVQPPKPKEPSPKLNLLEMLVRGEGALNKVQARTAFAMYLIRVQQRLTTQCNTKNADDVDAMNEQMDLVLRFLKRAAVNLQQSFKVIVPSRKLPINDRRRILAKQLGNFVHIYTKETEQLKVRQEPDKKGIKRTPSKESLNEDKFEKFINIASETELEEVLTTYTKLNKSASIFLGTKSPNKGETESTKVQAKRKELSVPVEQPVQVPKTVPAETPPPPPTFLGWEEIPPGSKAHSVYLDGPDHHLEKRMMRPPSGRLPMAPVVYETPTEAAFANAVAVYSAKLTRSRPSSASNNKAGSRPTGHRPSSAVTSRPSSAGKTDRDRGYAEVYNEKAINEALQKLALKQQARQYSATNSSTVGFQELPTQPPRPTLYRSSSQQSVRADVFRTRSLSTGDSSISDVQAHLMKRPNDLRQQLDSRQGEMTPGKYIAIEEHQLSMKPPTGPHNTLSVRGDNLGKLTKDSISHGMRTSSTAFNNFVHETAGPSWHNDVMTAYKQVTSSHHNKTGSTGSRPSYKVVQQQQLAKQQRLMAQSKALLESSKAKHLAMVAQAHAAQGRLSSHSSMSGSSRPASNLSNSPRLTPEPHQTSQQFEPKPPAQPAPNKKVNNQYRMSRTEYGAGTDQHGVAQYDRLVQQHQYPSSISAVLMK